jgi:excisionase family DNA binding protein
MSGGNAVGEGWITTAEAAELTEYHIKYLQQLARQGKVEAQKVGRSWLFHRDDLLTYQENARPGPKGKGGSDD